MGKEFHKIEIRTLENERLSSRLLAEADMHGSLRQAQNMAARLAETLKQEGKVLDHSKTAALIFDSRGRMHVPVLLLERKQWIADYVIRKQFFVSEEACERQPDKTWLKP